MTVTHETLSCDVLIVGSGAAGLATAVTAAFHGLDVLVVEKAPVLGGTSAWSGGWLWVPHNHLAQRAGITEDRSGPRNYLRSELGNRANDPRLDVFLDNAPEMALFMEEHAGMDWIDGNGIPDFHQTEGHLEGGRSLSVAPFDGRKLGHWINRLRPPLDVMSIKGMGIASGADMSHFLNATRKPRSAIHVARRFLRHGSDMARYGRSMHLVNGNALVARLLSAAVRLGVRIECDAPATELLRDGPRVTGATVTLNGTPTTMMARRGVVLAAGGFPHDKARIAQHFDHAPTGMEHHSAAPATNTGDGIRLGEGIGAATDFTLAQPGAWAPVSQVPDGKGGFTNFPHLVERAKPGFIALDSQGQRFVNEADSYHDFMSALFDRTPKGQTPHCWLICDHAAQRRFGLGWAKPFPLPLKLYLANGYLKTGRTLRDLAAACNLPADTVEASVARFNRFAVNGQDPDFGRGGSRYNKVQGWGGLGKNPALGPLDSAPFYAVRIVPGSLGTFAGLQTDPQGRALTAEGQAIVGLFAVGNDAASIMGGNYPSGGITLGPGMTFGYIIGRTLAGLPITGFCLKEDA
jgi:succinate dehydrogenase/fumarate reductase flavoprotein subunit